MAQTKYAFNIRTLCRDCDHPMCDKNLMTVVVVCDAEDDLTDLTPLMTEAGTRFKDKTDDKMIATDADIYKLIDADADRWQHVGHFAPEPEAKPLSRSTH